MTLIRLKHRERRLFLAVVMVMVLCGPIVGWRALAAARWELARSAALHVETLVAGRRFDTLSRQRPIYADQPRPEPDLVARITSRMTEAGLGADQVGRVSASSPQPVADGALRRQTASITLTVASPADLARFLTAWSDAEPAWTVASVRLDRSGRAAEGGYTANVTLESLHVPMPPDGGSGTRRSESRSKESAGPGVGQPPSSKWLVVSVLLLVDGGHQARTRP